MTDKNICLQFIGDISVQWSQVEDDLRELLWVYVGTDRPTFDLLFDKARGTDIENLLRRIINGKETDRSAKSDALEALSRSKVIRDNRNTILHKMRADHVDDPAALQPKLEQARDEIISHSEALRMCRERLTNFVARRDALETADGALEHPDSDRQIPTYEAVDWPAKCKKLVLEE